MKLLKGCEPPRGCKTEEMDVTAYTASTLETTVGAITTPAKGRREFVTVLLLAPDPHTGWVHDGLRLGHVTTPSHLELSFYNGRPANLLPTLLRWGIPPKQETVSNVYQPK